jgi:hypothetical protein
LHEAYLIAYTGMPRNHHSIFIQKGTDGSGELFHVIGDIQNGMTFEHRSSRNPDESTTFASKQNIGKVSEANYDRVESILRAIPPPKKQYNRNVRLYPKEPLRRCQEWTAEAIEKLKEERVLQS